MNPRLIFSVFLLSLMPASAATIRVSTWDLQPGPLSTNRQAAVQNAAESLKKLRPDVILLQQAPAWDACRQLAQALKPEVYRLVVCSTFHGPQVAILSTAKAYIAWSESWKSNAVAPGGFAFAVMRFGDKNLGVFSVQAGENSTGQIVRQIDALRTWKHNRPDAFIIAGDLNSADLPLEQIGFENASPQAPSTSIFTRDAGFVESPVMAQAPPYVHSAATCEMDLDGPRAARAPPPAPVATGRHPSILLLAVLLAGFLALLIIARKLGRRPPELGVATWSPRPIDGPASPRMTEAVRAGVIANLSLWMKQRIVLRLIADRSQLAATQQAAALKVLEVDERLAKIERQIQESQREYEHRIDALLQELIAAKEENRELIRSKIALVKAEMENARLKAEQRATEQHQY